MAKAYRGHVVTLPYVQPVKNRYGNVYWYFRREGRRIPLPGKPGSPQFMLAYNAALAGFTIEAKPLRSPAGSVSAAIAEYYRDNSFLGLATGTRKMRRAILERFREDFGDLRLADFAREELALLLGKKRPFAARNWLKTLRGLMAFAVATGLRQEDPTQGIKPAKAKAGSIHTWTEDEIAIFERHHAIGSRGRLAMALMLYTAARRGDAILLGRQHIRAGRITYRQQKTGRSLSIPLHPKLAEIIAATTGGDLAFLVTGHGKPFASSAAFGNWFRQVCNDAGLPQCSSHGLRKAQARRLAELGRSTHQIGAVTGHRTLSEIQHYTEAADQEKLANEAFGIGSGRPNRKPRLATSTKVAKLCRAKD